MKNILLLFVLLLTTAFACKKSTDSTTASSTEQTTSEEEVIDGHTSMESLDWSGVYTGILPCPEGAGEDCQGIRYNIELSRANTYKLTSYQTNNPAERMTESGKLSWDDSGVMLNLKSEESSHKFKAAEGYIVKLADDGTELGNENLYRLTKL